MDFTFQQYEESAQAIRARLKGFVPKVAMVLGSGLGSLGEEVESPIFVPYGEVPHMKRSTAPDHAGRFVFGRLAGQDVAVMQGRLHTYEGWSFEDVSYPVRVLRLLGAETLVVTNAAGAVEPRAVLLFGISAVFILSLMAMVFRIHGKRLMGCLLYTSPSPRDTR